MYIHLSIPFLKIHNKSFCTISSFISPVYPMISGQKESPAFTRNTGVIPIRHLPFYAA